jgi:hypothetical protein
MGSKPLASLGLSTLLFTGLGCSMLQKMARVNLYEGDNAAQAAAKIKEKVGGEVRVIRAEVRRDRMEVTVRSNKNPKDIDKYEFKNGSVNGPEPVQVMSLGSLEMTGEKYQTMDIDEIGWAALPATVARAKELSKLENAEINLISMAFEHPVHTAPKDSPESKKPLGSVKLVFTWRLFVEGPRGRKDFWADKTGKLNETPF